MDRVLRDAIQHLFADLDHAAFSAERNGPHVVVTYDPETASLAAYGVYPDAPTAFLAAEAMSADFNRPENDDGVAVRYFPVPLDLSDTP